MAGAATIKSLHISCFAAEGDLAFRIGTEQFGPKQIVVRFGRRRRQIDSVAGEIRVFVQDHAKQSDGGCLRDSNRMLITTGGLSAAGYGIDAQLRRWPYGFQRLCEVQ